jgi:hypothetical protein
VRHVRAVAVWTLLAGAPAFAACNMVTGAGDIRLDDDDDGSSSSADASSAAATGAGGATSGQQAATGSGVGGATSSTAANGSTSSSTGSGAGGSPTVCDYPAGPYGVAQGSIVPPTLSWQGFVPGSNTPSTISIQDLFDCDGTRGIDAIIIDTSQYG